MAIAIKGANALVTYLNLPSGRYYISNVYGGGYVSPYDSHSNKQPIVISQRQIVSPSLYASSYIDHLTLKWNDEYLENGLTFSLSTRSLLLLKKNSIWSDPNSIKVRWLIKQRVYGVNEYTYVHCDSVVNICLRSLNLLSIIYKVSGKGWTVWDKNVGIQVSSCNFTDSLTEWRHAGVSRGCPGYRVHPTADWLRAALELHTPIT